MICKNCGRQNDNGSSFCVFCGARQEIQTIPVAAPVPEQPKSKKGCLIAAIIAGVALLLVLGILVLVVLGILGFQFYERSKPNIDGPGYSQQENEVQPVETVPELAPYEAVRNQYSSYVFPNSDSRYLSYANIDSLTDEARIIAEQEIYARHGEVFSDPDIQAYFDSRSWYYRGTGTSSFNKYEEANLELFDVYRRKQNGTLYQGDNVYINAFPAHQEYAISYSNTRYLADSDLRYMTENQLCVARNEILARNGRIFKDPYLREYFLSQPWYKPTLSSVDFNTLSIIEQSNYKMIEKYEDQAEINEGAVWSSANPYKVVYEEHGSVAYLFPNSDSSYLSSSSLRGMTKLELTIAWAEIYARHGYIFNDYYLDEYFAHRNWYSAKTSNKNALGLNSYEKENIRLIEEKLNNM